ncbi:MAG: hypothetical protein NZ891_04910, partial [bacterium]|nr:hypothetical protein [bacterium]MDW8164064.1 hypothetical protein [Candidatus Omnitrophota bacterium]
IFDLTSLSDIVSKRPFTILPGHPDYDPRYDFFFSDFTNTNLGSGILVDLGGIQYRLTYNDSDILTDLRKIIKIDNKFYAIGEKGVILESSDGTNWNVMTFEDASYLYGIYGTSGNNIWACGENGRIIRFDGNRWNREDIGINWGGLGIDISNLPTFYNIYIDNSNNVWVVGSGGIILRYNGTTWSRVYTSLEVNLYGIWGIGNTFYVVGEAGTILKYDGINWLVENSGINDDLYTVWGSNANNIYVFGNIEVLSKIGYLYNTGYGWQLQTTNIPSIKNNKKRVPIYSIDGDGTNIYAVGKNGTIIKFNGINWSDISPTGLRDAIYGVCVSNLTVFIVGGSGLTGFGDGTQIGWNIQNKWETWKNYESSISLPDGITSIEYFAIDNLGNEEEHHKIVDPGRGIRKDIYDGKGTGNLRSDDNVPDPDIIITPSQPDGDNGWYRSAVKITFTYKDENNWLDPLPNGDLGSGIKKFQYALLNTSGDPTNFVDYTADKQALQQITLTDGYYYIY